MPNLHPEFLSPRSALNNSDFVKLAEAYGARGVRVQHPEALESAIREAITINAPSLIEVPVQMTPTPFEG